MGATKVPPENPLSDLLGHLKKHLGAANDTPNVSLVAPCDTPNDYVSVDHLIHLAYQWRVSRRYLTRLEGKGPKKDAAIIEERRRAVLLMKALGELRGEFEDP